MSNYGSEALVSDVSSARSRLGFNIAFNIAGCALNTGLLVADAFDLVVGNNLEHGEGMVNLTLGAFFAGTAAYNGLRAVIRGQEAAAIAGAEHAARLANPQ